MTVVKGAERAHALLSASSAHRWLTCPPSARLEDGLPDTESDAAKEGTVAHALAEIKALAYFYPADMSKQKVSQRIAKLKKDEHWDDEMLGYTDLYLDFLKESSIAFPSKPYVQIEKKVSYDRYAKEGFGTADCLMIGGDTLHIIDFKYGKGVEVSPEHNPQLMLYALGAIDLYAMIYDIRHVKLSIVQPRTGNPGATWEITRDELDDFGKEVQEIAPLAWDGKGDFNPGVDQCRFCRAGDRCRARAEHFMDLEVADKMLPPLITWDEGAMYLRRGADLVKWYNKLKDSALKEILSGGRVPGYKAVAGRSSRKWIDRDKAFKVLNDAGYPDTVLTETVDLTIPAIEKAIGKKDFTKLTEKLIVKQPGVPTLVEGSDKRPALEIVKATDVFEEGGSPDDRDNGNNG